VNRPARPPSLSRAQWLVAVVAGLGFAFSQYEILVAPLIVRPVLTGLGGLQPGTSVYNTWAGLLFFLPAATGGAVGLLGGTLADRFGRRRVLVWSIVFYGGASLAAAYCTSLVAFLLWRCVTWVGVCVEYVAAIAWVAELFEDPHQRERVLGLTQACIGIGGFLVTGVYYGAVTFAEQLPPILGTHDAWRYTLALGIVPALTLVIVRPFAPESPLWLARLGSAGTRRPRVASLFAPDIRRTTIAATLLVACCYALPYGAIQQTPRIVPGLAELRGASPRHVEQTVTTVQLVQELGGLSGRLLFSFLVVGAVTRQRLLRGFLVPAALAFAWLYFSATSRTLGQVVAGVFVASLLFNALLSFWGNYLPRMYPTRLRATGESFAMNVGGRIMGTSAALMTTQLASVIPGAGPAVTLSRAAGLVSVVACVIGTLGSFALQEPAGARLPD